MKKILIVLETSVIVLFILLSPGYTQQKSILLKTEKLTHLTNPPLIIAKEGVEVLFEGMLIKAKKIRINLNTTETKAEGEVHLNFDSYRIKGKSLGFNLKEKKGFIEKPQGKEKKVIFQGARARLSSREVNLLKGSFTTCDLPSPHYHIKAETLQFYPGEKIVVKNAVFYLGSTPVFWTPTYVYHLTKKNKLTLPRLGKSRYTGWYIKTGYSLYPVKETEAVIHLDWYQKKGLAGGLDLSYSSGKNESSLKTYYIKENDTGTVRGVGRIRWMNYLSTSSLLKLNANYLTDKRFFEDYLYHLPTEEKQIFPTSLTLDFKEKGTGLMLQFQKRISPVDDYPELLPRTKLTLLHPSQLLRGLYIKQKTELTGFVTEEEGNVARLWSCLNLSYPQTFLNYIRFKPTLGGELFWYKQENKNTTSNTINYQNYEFFLSSKGRMGDLVHRLSSTFGWYQLGKSGPDLPELDYREKRAKEENMLRWRVQNKFSWKKSTLFLLNLKGGYDLSTASEKIKPVRCSLNIPLRWGSLQADFSYDFYDKVFPYLQWGADLRKEKWHLEARYSNYLSGEEFISAVTSFYLGKSLSLSGKIGYNLGSKKIEKLEYGANVKLHCLGLKLSVQEKPFFDYNISFYITAFPF